MWVRRHPAASLVVALCLLIALALPLLRSKIQSLGEKTAEAVATADQKSQAAAASESRAQAAETQVQREQYADLLQQAHEQLLLGNRRMASDLLDLCDADDRCWVWRYLRKECDASKLLTSVGASSAVTITPDGAWAIASFAGRIQGWETDSLTRVLQITPDQNGTALDLSASSQNILAGLFKNSIQCWDLLTGEPIASWPLEREPGGFDFQHPGQIQFGQDGKTLFLARSGSLSAWEPRSQQRRWNAASLTSISHLAVSPDNLLVAVAGEDEDGPAVQVLDASLGEPMETIPSKTQVLGVQLSLTADNEPLIVTLHEDRLRFHTLELPANNGSLLGGTGARIPDLANAIREIEQTGALCLAKGASGQIVVGASQGLRVYDPMHRRLTHDLRGGSATHATICANAQSFAVVARDEINRPYLWRPAGAHGVPEQLGLLQGVFDASLSRFAATSTGRFHWTMLDAEQAYHYQLSRDPPFTPPFVYVDRANGQQAVMKSWKPEGPSPHVAIAISPEGKTIATGDRFLRVWSEEGEEIIEAWKADLKASAKGMTFSDDGELLAVSTDDNVQLWDLSQRQLVRTLEEPGGFALAFSHDRSRLAVTRHIHTIMTDIGVSAKERQQLDATIVSVFEVASGDRTQTFKATHVFDVPSCVAFSLDGTQLAAGLSNGTVRSWNLASGEAMKDIRAGESACLGVAFTPDSRRLATVSVSEVLIWDVTTRRRLLALAYDSGMTQATAGYSQVVVPPIAMAAWGDESRELEETPAIIWTNSGRSQLRFSADGQRLGFWSPYGRHFWSAETASPKTRTTPNPFLDARQLQDE